MNSLKLVVRQETLLRQIEGILLDGRINKIADLLRLNSYANFV
jgi:hypothetical protein